MKQNSSRIPRCTATRSICGAQGRNQASDKSTQRPVPGIRKRASLANPTGFLTIPGLHGFGPPRCAEPLMRLSRLSTDVSVRSRLIVLSLIPVVGFAAIAFAYLSSERAVEAAFGSVQQSSRLAEASRTFKESLTSMQSRAKDFVAQPQPGLIARFNEAQDAAFDSLRVIQELADQTDKPTLTALAGRVANLKATFARLTADQDELGLTEFEGIQGSLRDGGNAMERIVTEDMSWLSEADQRKILIPLMLMRRAEVEYRLTRAEPSQSAFKQELTN